LSARTLGILLAGGRGERLGLGRPKALAELRGATLLERACRTLARVCDDVVVAAPAEMALPLPPGVRRLLDPGVGPLGGVAVAAQSILCDRAVVLGVDYPLLEPAMLEALLDLLGERRAVVPAPGGRTQPLAAAYSAAGLDMLSAAFERGERSIVNVLGALDPLVLEDAKLAELPGGSEGFFDVDTPEELARAEERA
jgi:molybdopterin-guanine dinucleotide biosynthesis protein A